MSEAIEYPIDGVLDLHTFHPRDIKTLLPEYIQVCQEQEIRQIRIIHGKGKGVLREMVQQILERSPAVEMYWQESAGGSWGATIARLKTLEK